MSRPAEQLPSNSRNFEARRGPASVMEDGSINWRAWSEAKREGRSAEFIAQVEAADTGIVAGVAQGARNEHFGLVRGLARNKARTLTAAIGLTSIGAGIVANYDSPHDSAPAVYTQNISLSETVGPRAGVSIDQVKQTEIVSAAEAVVPVVSVAVQAEQAPAITRSSQLTDEQGRVVLDMADGKADGVTEAVVSVKDGNSGYDTRDWALARTIDNVVDTKADPGTLFNPQNPSVNGALRWADFTTVAKTADGTDYAKGGAIYDGDRLKVDPQSLVATFKAADLKLAPEVIARFAAPAAAGLTEAQINTVTGGLVVAPVGETIVPATVANPANITESVTTNIQTGVQGPQTPAQAEVGPQGSAISTEKSAKTEDIRYASGNFYFEKAESNGDGTAKITVAPESQLEYKVILNVREEDANILTEDQNSGSMVKIESFEADNKINYVYRHAGSEVRLYSVNTPAYAAVLKAEEDARKAEEESFWQYYQTLMLLGVAVAAIGAGLMTTRRTRKIGAALFTGSVLGIPGVIAALETQNLPTYPAAGSLAVIAAALAIFALKSKDGETGLVGDRADLRLGATGRRVTETI